MEETDALLGSRDDGISTNSLASTVHSLTDDRLRVVKRHSWKNLLGLSVAFAFIFTAYISLQNLESSLNQKADLGLISLSTIYACVIISCLFAPYLLDVLGTKWTLVGCSLCYCFYTAANFHPIYKTMIPGSIILGLAAAPLWAAQGVYLTTTAIEYSKFSDLITGSPSTKEAVISRFNGVFFLIFQFSQVIGNVISSLVLFRGDTAEADDDLDTNYTNLTPTCGRSRCPADSSGGNLVPEPEDHLRILLLTVYMICGLMGFLVLLIFLDKLKTVDDATAGDDCSSRPSRCGRLLTSLKLLSDWRLLLLIPLTIYAGVEQAIMAGVFTEAYITCSLGVHYVGFIMAVAAVFDSLSSALLGRLNKVVGRISIFSLGFVFHLALYLAQILWEPDANRKWIFFLLAVIWGIGDAVWQLQINSLLGVIFSDKQKAAFSNLTMWRSVGFTITFAYSSSACVSTKLYITLGLLIFSFILYVLLEILLNLRSKGKKKFRG